MIHTVLIVLYVACELIANITASKPVDVFGLVAPGGVFIYAITFTLIDLINERLGKQGARRVIFAAFAANLLLAAYTLLIVRIPSPPFYAQQEAFAVVLGSTPRIVIASLTAYFVSSMIDVELFVWLKQRLGQHKWARVFTSNAVSTLVDSAVFVAIAFAGVMPLVQLIAGQYVLKMAVTVLSLPLIYLVHGRVAGSGVSD
jgi:queuosine precursor transporter